MSKSTAVDDPYYTVRDNVQSNVEKTKLKHEKFQDLVMNTNTYNNTEFKELRKSLVKDVRTADKHIRDLKATVDMADRNREKFKHISDTELAQRKRFVDEMLKEIAEVKTNMESQAVRRKMEDDENRAKYVEPTAIERENANFVREQKGATQQILKDQDVQLTHLGDAVDRLHGVGSTINAELKEQNSKLDDLQRDMEEAESKMTFVMSKLQKLLKTKDGCQIWTIVILAVVLIILVALVIFV